MTGLVVAAGCVVGVLCGILSLRWRGKSRQLAASYGIVGAGAVWATAAIIAGNMADGMAGIGHLVAGGAVFWLLIVPAIVYVLLVEGRRSRADRS